MEDEEYKEVDYYGIVISSSGDAWYSLCPQPLDKLDWMNDNERLFLVVQPKYAPQRVMFSAYTFRADAKGKIKVEKEKE